MQFFFVEADVIDVGLEDRINGGDQTKTFGFKEKKKNFFSWEYRFITLNVTINTFY